MEAGGGMGMEDPKGGASAGGDSPGERECVPRGRSHLSPPEGKLRIHREPPGVHGEGGPPGQLGDNTGRPALQGPEDCCVCVHTCVSVCLCVSGCAVRVRV